MKIKHLYSIVFLLSAGFLFLTAFTTTSSIQKKEGNEKIIKFSHELHSSLATCEECHSGVVESISLKGRLLPNKPDCAGCHDVEDPDDCSTCHYEDVYEPLIQKKSELLFNHNQHVSGLQVQCEDCHRGLSSVEYSFQAAAKNPPMVSCYSCHNDKSVASNACESCHISTANLLPQDHKIVNFNKFHKFAANSMDANCAMCHDNNSCEACHVGTTMLSNKNTASDFYMPYQPDNFVDGVKTQKISRVHDLNFRFTHGIDLKGKVSDCQSCHQIETFCVDCHSVTGGDFALAGIIPSSHIKPNFVLFGGNGGEHAILARRDIERCIACHDTRTADPSCIMCHSVK